MIAVRASARAPLQRFITPALLTVLAVASACHPLKKLKISTADQLLVEAGAVAVAVDQNNIYWFGNGAVHQAPRASPAQSIILGQGIAVLSIVVDGSSVYWANLAKLDSQGSEISNSGTIMKAPIGGGQQITLAHGQDRPVEVVVDANNVYWNTRNNVMKAPISGGDSSQLASGSLILGFAVDDRFAYWIDRPSSFAGTGLLRKVPLSGGGITTLYDTLTAPGPMLRDGDDLYWIDYGTYIPDDNGDDLQLDGQIQHQLSSEMLFSSFATAQQSPQALAKANDVLYWINGDVQTFEKNHRGNVMLYGPRGVEQVAPDQKDPRRIAAVGTDVYWTTQTGIMHASVK